MCDRLISWTTNPFGTGACQPTLDPGNCMVVSGFAGDSVVDPTGSYLYMSYPHTDRIAALEIGTWNERNSQ